MHHGRVVDVPHIAGDNDMHGLDIGCAANLVYALLGAAAFGWRMTAIDTDHDAVAHANQILSANAHLQPLISAHVVPHQAAPSGAAAEQACSSSACASPAASSLPLLRAREATPGQSCDTIGGILSTEVARLGPFAFCVCNPPFFETPEEASQNPATAVSGTPTEMACPGGEVAFVATMVEESRAQPQLCHWFTSMLGKKTSFKQLRQRVKGLPEVTAVRSTSLVQGRTHRWVLAWSFCVPRELADRSLAQVNPRCGAADAAGAHAAHSSAAITGRRAQKRSMPDTVT